MAEESYTVGEEEKRTLFEACYKSLRGYSHGQMRHERKEHTLDATEVVHEAYVRMMKRSLKFLRSDSPDDKKKKFRSFACKQIKWVCIDYSRYLKAEIRGGENSKIVLDLFQLSSRDLNTPAFHLQLEEMMERLVSENENSGETYRELVDLSCYGNHTDDELAGHFSVSRRTIDNRKAAVIAFFKMELGQD